MSNRLADELEHRRGLVLGLTLAEVLLLLLFVLLHAFSWKMLELQRVALEERKNAEELTARITRFEATFESLAPLLAELKKRGGLKQTTVDQLVHRLSRVEELESE